jgi:hypothetical protein|tara:strand:+ start:462 stop:692 length:231 start_codon:yes stop_codon:yes gene_type:complete
MSITQSNKRPSQKQATQLQSRSFQIPTGQSFKAALNNAIKKNASTFAFKGKSYTTSVLKNKMKKVTNGTSTNKTKA